MTTGMQVLEEALAKAEAEERGNNRTLNPQHKQVRFVHGGTLQPGLRTTPSLYTSVGTNTNDGDDTPAVTITPRASRCEIPMDYTRINQMQLEGHLGSASVFDMARLYLAYLCKNKESHYQGQTYVSVRVKLRAIGFPEDNNSIKEVYLKYCNSQGVSTEEAENDLQILERYIRERKRSQAQLTERQRREEAGRIDYGSSSCDPECVIL